MELKFQTPGRAGSVGELAGNLGNLSCWDWSMFSISYPWPHGQVKYITASKKSFMFQLERKHIIFGGPFSSQLIVELPEGSPKY